MDLSDGRSGASIGPAVCMGLLAAGGVGRVAVSIGAVPAVFPVRYALLEDEVVFRTARGTSFDAAVRNAVVAFEIDDLDPQHRGGWSVLLIGTADEITDDARLARAAMLGLPPAPGPEDHVMAIRPELISGRRNIVSPL